MNEIRKNYETEVEILRIKFKIPAVVIIINVSIFYYIVCLWNGTSF